MAFLDSKLIFSDAQALTSVNATEQVATNVIDLGADGKDAFGNAMGNVIGAGNLNWFVSINVAMATAAKIMTVDLVTGDAVSTGAISSSIKIARLEFPAESPAGTKRSITLPGNELGRYLGVEYLATATLASVTVDSALILGPIDSEISAKFQG